MLFVANLRQETIDAFTAESIQPDAYLLSSHRVSPALLGAAAVVRELGLPLFADNGTKALIDATIDRFSQPSAELRQHAKELRRTLGHMPRGRDVPDALRLTASTLANSIVAHATDTSEAISVDGLIEAQLAMRPTDLIAQEDFATACLVALGLERELTGWTVARFDTRNRRSLRLWRRITDRLGSTAIRIHAVLSAVDYNTARSAGTLAARAGVRHAAIGMAGITRDSSATDFFVMGTASLGLERPAPRRYVRLAQILRGIADGYVDAGRRLESFHCLGLGAPSMFPLAAAALPLNTAVTTDATSPIHDAVRDRVLYDADDHGRRVTTFAATVRIIQGRDWGFRSPFSATFRDVHGHNPEQARAWWRDHGEPELTQQHLEVPSDLTVALPLFCEADPVLRIAAQKCRIASNHWVLGAIASQFQEGPRRREAALDIIETLTGGEATVTVHGLKAARTVLTRHT